MKKLLMRSDGEHFSLASSRTAFVFLIAVGLASSFSAVTAPVALAADMTPTQMIQSQLPQGKTMADVTKTEFLGAVCRAVKKFREAAPAIKAAINAHPEWRREILRAIITYLGTDDCNLIAQTVAAAASGAFPDDANGLVELGIQLAPKCRDTIGQIPSGGVGEFTNPPINQNPPPGTVGGGGGGGFNPEDTRLTVCDNGVNVIVLASQLAAYLTAHSGAFVGACVVTPSTNQ